MNIVCFYLMKMITLLFSIFITHQAYSMAKLRFPTEAGFCTGCDKISNLKKPRPSLTTLATETEKIYRAAYYTNNGDRTALSILREKQLKTPELLTEIEKAILQAADRSGFMFLPGCKSGNNAFLININGRDAIVTAGHTVTFDKTYAEKCSASEDAFYYPNMGHYDETNGEPGEGSFALKKVKLEPNPINFDKVIGNKSDLKDFLVYFLEEDVSKDIMPNGNVRGAIPFSTKYKHKGQAYILGFDGKYDESNPRQMTYQECNFRQTPTQLSYFRHTCDTSKGASGSLLGTIENGELTFQALNVSGESTFDTEIPESDSKWNGGVSSEIIKNAIPK